MARGSRNAAVLVGALIFICIVLWAMLLAFPYWSYPPTLHAVCTAILIPCCLLLPVVFFFGYGARSGEAQALHEVATEARIQIQALKASHQQHSHHEPAQSAASSAMSPEVAGPGARPDSHESRGHHHADSGQTATSHADPLQMTHIGAQSGQQHSDGAQHHANHAQPSQPTASSANAPPSASSEAQPGSPVNQKAFNELSHSGISQDPIAAASSSQAAHLEDSPPLQTGLSGPLQEQRGRQVPSRAEQPERYQDLDSLPGQHSTPVTPLLSADRGDLQTLCNGRQMPHSPSEHVPADANGHAHHEQSASAQSEQAASFSQRPPDLPSPGGEPAGAGGETAAESEATAARAGHEGTRAAFKSSTDLPSSDEPAFKKPSRASAADAPCQGGDKAIRQLSHNVSEQPVDCATDLMLSWPSQVDEDSSTTQDSRHPQMEADVPARPRSPFDRLRLEALLDGPSDGVPEAFPNADTFRANTDCRPQQPDATDHLSISRQQQDSFSFPPLIDGVPFRQRSPAVSMEPTRAAAGAFGSSVLNYDHQLQQRPGLLTAPGPSVLPGAAPLTPPSLSSDHAQATGAEPLTAISMQDISGLHTMRASGNLFSTKTGPSLAGTEDLAEYGLEDSASGASGQASPTTAYGQETAANRGMSPVHTPGALLPLAQQHVKPYGCIRSGRLGEEGEGSDSSTPSSPVFSHDNSSPMRVRNGGQDVGFTHDSVTPIRSPSPLGSIRAGRLGE